MIALCKELMATQLLTPVGLWRLLQALVQGGVNLMALLHIAAHLHPRRTALVTDDGTLTYQELWRRSEVLARLLQQEYGVNGSTKVALICRNHGAAVTALFAVARLGASLYLINPEMSPEQICALGRALQIDRYLYDTQLAALFRGESFAGCATSVQPLIRSLPTAGDAPSIAQSRPLARGGSGRVVVLTGGTTGQPKAVARQPSLLNFLAPFCAFLSPIGLGRQPSLYIATPLCHGYGLALLLLGIALGRTLYLTERFQAERACTLIATHRIAAMVVVPLMLQRMLNHDCAALAPLRCIICGSAPLSPPLATTTLDRLGPILFNLYGTSEAGFSLLATPALLQQKPDAIGKPILGVRANVVDAAGNPVAPGAVGQLQIHSAWSVDQRWVATGDLARQDAEGDFRLCGRVDDMIVSGGENVYPLEVEAILATHPALEAVAVIGIPDAEFGQRLHAFVVCRPAATVDEAILLAWLKPRVARYQLPAKVTLLAALPYTAVGKVNRRALG